MHLSARPAPVVIPERTRTLIQQQPIRAQLPYRCPWGAQIHEIPVGCGSCQQPIDPAWMRGLIKLPIPGMVEVETVAVCHPCHRIMAITFRLYEDGRVLVGSGGRWLRAAETPRWRAAWTRVRKLLRGFRKV